MSAESESMARELLRITGLINAAAATIKVAKHKRPTPQAAIDVAIHCDRAVRCMRAGLDLLRRSGGESDPAAWGAVVMAAASAGIATGIALEYERRAAGNGTRKATERRRKLDELAMEPQTAYRIGQTEAIVGLEPESVAQAVRRRRLR